MPIFLVDKEFLNMRHECVVCPTKPTKYFCFDGIDGLIYDKAGKSNLIKAFDDVNPYDISIPAVTSGFELSDYVIHIIGPDLIYVKDFKKDIYNAYNLISRLILKNNFKSIVYPPIPFSYKRLGGKNSYRTGITFIKYFYNLYSMDVNIYVLVDKQVINDHVNNYLSTYVSTSDISRRHKPIVYPLNNDDELKEYIESNKLLIFKELLKPKKYELCCIDEEKQFLYDMIKEKFKDDDVSFCFKANLSRDSFYKIFTTKSKMQREELLGITISLNLDAAKINEILLKFKFEILKSHAPSDQIILKSIEQNIFNVNEINEILFLNDLKQLGSNAPENNQV